VIGATDPHGRNLGFLDPEPLLFHSSSSSIILTRLSGPRNKDLHNIKNVHKHNVPDVNYYIPSLHT
jgi:hypothetical protein